MTVSKTRRATARKALQHHSKYDAATMRISADGMVSAKIDAHKTATQDARRYNVAHIDDIVDQAGAIREGWQKG